MNPDLHMKALQCVKNYKKCEKELINILEEIDGSKSYLVYGVSSLFRYCVEKLGLSEADTYRFIQVTRKAAQVPELKSAIENGVLSVSKASRIATVITSATHKTWIEKATLLTHRELEREVAKEIPTTERKERLKVLTPSRSELRVSISVDLERKLERAKEVLRTGSIEETLEKLVDLALKQKDPVERAKRAASRSNPQFKPAASSRLKWPATPATWQAKTPAEIPRTVPARQIRNPIPQSIRHQVNLRDQGRCTTSGCRESKWVEVHHLTPVSKGGTHTLSNLTTLCSGHHSQIHGHQKSRWKR